MIYLNARFLMQPVSGVQRYARELVSALDRALAGQETGLGPVVALHPAGAVEDPGWQAIGRRVVGGGQGHRWEQAALAHAARDGVLLSLGNSGPLWHRRHVVCFHDANIWAMPGAFSGRYRLFHRALRPRLARRAAGLITVSRYSAGELAFRLGVPEDRFTIVPNSAAHILSVFPDEGALRRLGLRRKGYLLAVGNRSPNKNVARLVAAHGLAGDAVPPLVVAGGVAPGLAASAEISSDRVRYVGRAGDGALRALYDGAAGFVFPSLHEGFGIPPLEAMQLGVPVLAARASALPEVLGDAPLWFDPRNQEDMARALRDFAGLDRQALAGMAEAGLAQASRFTWQDSAGRLIALLRRCQLPEGRSTVSAVRAIRPRSVSRLMSRR